MIPMTNYRVKQQKNKAPCASRDKENYANKYTRKMSTGQPITPEEGLRYLINAVTVGQTRGVWKLAEAATIQQAINAVQPFFTIRQAAPQVSMQSQRLPAQSVPQPFDPNAGVAPIPEDGKKE